MDDKRSTKEMEAYILDWKRYTEEMKTCTTEAYMIMHHYPVGIVPASVYYNRLNRERVCQQHGCISGAQEASICKDEWSKLDTAGRQEYKELNELDKKRFTKEMEAYIQDRKNKEAWETMQYKMMHDKKYKKAYEITQDEIVEAHEITQDEIVEAHEIMHDKKFTRAFGIMQESSLTESWTGYTV